MPLQCGTWKYRFLVTSGPMATGSKRMSYGAGGALASGLAMTAARLSLRLRARYAGGRDMSSGPARWRPGHVQRAGPALPRLLSEEARHGAQEGPGRSLGTAGVRHDRAD